jgi:hypothetical protein
VSEGFRDFGWAGQVRIMTAAGQLGDQDVRKGGFEPGAVPGFDGAAGDVVVRDAGGADGGQVARVVLVGLLGGVDEFLPVAEEPVLPRGA